MAFRRIVFFCIALASIGARAETAFESATTLYRAKRYPEARIAFEQIVANEPANAAACHYLGLIVSRRSDPTALAEAVKWLEKSVALEPENAGYLADFGGVSLQLAGETKSYSAATKGRDAMEKAIRLDPGNLDARQGLMLFYQRAPWPLGSSSKAAAQLEAIRRIDPDLGTVLGVRAQADARKYAAAFAICDSVLAANPDNYIALYEYGRTATLCGQNLSRALECLQHCVTLSPPGPAAPSPAEVWIRIGFVYEQTGRQPEARLAYESALKADPGNQGAAAALAKLK